MHESVPGQVSHAHHVGDLLSTLVGEVGFVFRQHDVHFIGMRQIVQYTDDRPAVHLRLVDLLGAVVEARRITQAHGVGSCKQTERIVRADDAGLVEQRQLA